VLPGLCGRPVILFGWRAVEVPSGKRWPWSAPAKELCAAGRSEHLGLGGSNPAAVEADMAIPPAQFVRIAGACERLTPSECWVQSSPDWRTGHGDAPSARP
jgi:hypothetical protein